MNNGTTITIDPAAIDQAATAIANEIVRQRIGVTGLTPKQQGEVRRIAYAAARAAYESITNGTVELGFSTTEGSTRNDGA